MTSGTARSRDLFTIWFGSNIMMLTIVTGGAGGDGVQAVLRWAPSPHSPSAISSAPYSWRCTRRRGRTLGVPQMVQTRGQFGSIGALLVVGIVIVMYVGFLASNIVLGGAVACTPLRPSEPRTLAASC